MGLAALMGKEFSKAKACLLTLQILQGLGLGLALIGVFYAEGDVVLALGGFVVLVPFLSFKLREWANRHHASGERLRRCFLLHDTIGRKPSETDLLDFHADGTAFPSLEPRPIGTYYESSLPQGLPRLAHAVEESAFYTSRIARTTATVYSVVAWIGIAMAFVLLWFAVQNIHLAGSESGSIGRSVAKVSSALLVFSAWGTLSSLAHSYRSLADSTKSVYEKCGKLRRQETIDSVDLYLTVGGYDCVLAKSMPLPTTIYWLKRPRLAKAWKQVMRGDSASTRA